MKGVRLGPYQIVAELGSGGMGKVYRAEVAGTAPGLEPGLPVALKVIHPHLLETPGFFKRFLLEAEIGQSVEQDNVVRCFDCDALLMDGQQRHFLVMEYVEGQTLRDLLKELERVPEELCRHIGREAAKGLAAIHEAGVVHRDIKPENVLITPDHVVKVMDLGVARLQGEVMRLSQTGAFIGSIDYAPPEQLRGQDVDARGDLYALGVVLYELATGTHPYRQDDPHATIGGLLDLEPRRAGDVNPQLSPFFEEVVHTLIARDREQRFAAAADLIRALEEGEKGEWWKLRAKALRVETKRPLRRIRIPRETALYGRDDDLARLHTLYEKAKGGDGQVLLIEGEAGIGKTRLVDEFVGRLRQEGEDINFLFGSYPPGGAATASGAFSTAYREQFGEEGLEDTLEHYLTVTPLLVPAFAALLNGDATPTGAEPLTKDSLQTVFVHATRGLAAERTTVVLIDDLHFAPDEGKALFASLALAVPDHRILLIGTMRPKVAESWSSGITTLRHAEHRSLSRLGREELSALLRDAFRSERLAHELGARLAEKCDGNPFFAFEIIRGLKEGQLLTQRPDGTWVTTQIIEDIQVPSSVLSLVNARVADLDRAERELLEVASCCGFAFDPFLVADVADLSQIDALRQLGHIEKVHRLVRSSGRRFCFDHHQVQEALYEGLSEPLAEQYHAALAGALEGRRGAAQSTPRQLDGALCVDLCEHFLKGGKGGRALRYLDVALDHLEHGHLNDQTIALADRALSIPGLLAGRARLEVLLRKHRRLGFLGRHEAQEGALEEARHLAEAGGESGQVMSVAWAAGGTHFSLGRYEEAGAHFERRLALAREIGDRRSEGGATGNLGSVCLRLGRFEEALTHFERHLAIACEIGDARGEAHALGNLGIVLNRLGRNEEALDHLARSLPITREVGDRQSEAQNLGNLACVFLSMGRYDEAREHAERNVTIAREIGDRHSEASARTNLGVALQFLCRNKEAAEHAEQSLAIAREMGDRHGEASAAGNLGLACLVLGSYNEARDHLETWLATACEIGDRCGESQAHGNLGVALERLGRYEEALDHHTEHRALARDLGVREGEAHAGANLGLLLNRFGCYEEAEDHLGRSLSISREIADRRCEGCVLSGLGAVAHERGNTDRALDFVAKALALQREIRHGEGVADSLLQEGEYRWRAGQLDAAGRCLDETVDLLRKQRRAPELAHALALRASLPGGDVAAADSACDDVRGCVHTPEAWFYIWMATALPEHLAEAKRLLDYQVEHAPEEYRESMLRNVRLNREVMEAWAEHGEKTDA